MNTPDNPSQNDDFSADSDASRNTDSVEFAGRGVKSTPPLEKKNEDKDVEPAAETPVSQQEAPKTEPVHTAEKSEINNIHIQQAEKDSPTTLELEDKENEDDLSEIRYRAQSRLTVSSVITSIFSDSFLTNLLLAGLFSFGIFKFYNDFNESHRFSSLLTMIQLCCITLFFLIRVAPVRVTMKPVDWIVAIIGTGLPMLLTPVSGAHEIAGLMLLQLFGIFCSIVAIISLNTSFAVVPALRDVKTSGLYSIVRHPIYLSYFIVITCMVLQNVSLLNILILIAIYVTDIFRIIAEERVLSEDPDYKRYKKRVRYRLLPFVW